MSIDKAVPRLIRLGVESEAGRYEAELITAAGDLLIFNDETVWVRETGVVTSFGRGHRETALAAGGKRHDSPCRRV
jgi:hypothetical protein